MPRIIIAIDGEEGESPESLYRRLRAALKNTKLDWESTDDWFDDSGELLDEEEVSEIRTKVVYEKV